MLTYADVTCEFQDYWTKAHVLVAMLLEFLALPVQKYKILTQQE